MNIKNEMDRKGAIELKVNSLRLLLKQTRLAKNAAMKMPIRALRPRIRTIARAKPDGGQMREVFELS